MIKIKRCNFITLFFALILSVFIIIVGFGFNRITAVKADEEVPSGYFSCVFRIPDGNYILSLSALSGYDFQSIEWGDYDAPYADGNSTIEHRYLTGGFHTVVVRGVNSVPSRMCEGSSNLESVYISGGVSTVGTYAFYGCSSLKVVVLENGISEIKAGAFNSCSSLASITIPDSVELLGNYLFAESSLLKEVVIGKGITKISDGLFYNCSSLESIVLNSRELLLVGDFSFVGVGANCCLFGPAELLDDYKGSSRFVGRFGGNIFAIPETELVEPLLDNENSDVGQPVLDDNSFVQFSNEANISSDIFIKTISAIGLFAIVGIVFYIVSFMSVKNKKNNSRRTKNVKEYKNGKI